jgi:hypothetical protein
MPKKINTSATLKQSHKTESELQKELDKANAKIKGSKMVDVLIPEAYRAAFGDPLSFSVNGVSVEIPLNKKVKVPEAHALHAQRLMKGAVLSKAQKRLTPEEVYKD